MADAYVLRDRAVRRVNGDRIVAYTGKENCPTREGDCTDAGGVIFMVAELNDLAARISELESTSPTPAPDPLRAELDELACRIADLEARDTNERGLRERAEKAEKTIADVVKYANMELSIPSTTDRHEGIDIAIKGVLRIINSNK